MHLIEECPLFLTSLFMCLVLPLNVDKESRSLRTSDCANAGGRISSLKSANIDLFGPAFCDGTVAKLLCKNDEFSSTNL